MKGAVLALVLLFTLPFSVEAATLSFSSAATVPAGTEFPVQVYVTSEDRGFNAAEATISFPHDILEVVSVDAGVSATIFNFWLTYPEFSNENGTVVFSGGTTNGISGANIPLLTIHMRALGAGDALITADDASVNASDGSGTNILEEIEALRLAVPEPTVVIPPPVPVPTPPPPAVEPEPEPEEEPVTPDEETIESGRCTGIFADCALPFPSIKSVSVELYEYVGAELLVTGTAEESSHVHLLLRRDGVPYKEIVANVQPDGSWMGILSHIYAYGTYSLDAWSSGDDHDSQSEVTTWPRIDIYPPFTFHPFGFVLRWYAVATAVFGALVGLFALILIWRHLLRREPYRRDGAVVGFALSLIAFVAMFITAYVLWQDEYQSETTYWKDTDIECVLRADSWVSFYNSVELHIDVDGEPQTIPAEIGFSSECVASIHTHDDTGRLHFTSGVTLADFFTVAKIPFEQKGYELSMTVNGIAVSSREPGAYLLQNEDVIEMNYTSVNEETP